MGILSSIFGRSTKELSRLNDDQLLDALAVRTWPAGLLMDPRPALEGMRMIRLIQKRLGEDKILHPELVAFARKLDEERGGDSWDQLTNCGSDRPLSRALEERLYQITRNSSPWAKLAR